MSRARVFLQALVRLASRLFGSAARPPSSFEHELETAIARSGALLSTQAFERSLEASLSERFGANLRTPNNNLPFEFSNGNQ